MALPIVLSGCAVSGQTSQTQQRTPKAKIAPTATSSSSSTTAQVGIDLGLHDVVVLDSGEKVGNPALLRPRRAAVGESAAASWPRKSWDPRIAARRAAQVARIHARIADRRTDFLQKLSTRIIRENQTICVESLHVKAMVKHPTLAKAIH